MIFYLVSQKHSYTMRPFLAFWAKDFAHRINVLSYESLMYRKELKPGTYIFSDIERLTQGQLWLIQKVWENLADAKEGYCLLNSPVHTMRRYELLRTLYKSDLNRFNIYRLTECQTPMHYPVFLRCENDHTGNLTPLLWTPTALSNAIQGISKKKNGLADKVMVEFCDTSDTRGIFRKYSAFVVGERIIPMHILFGGNWMVKGTQCIAREESHLMEERLYIENNPHEHDLRQLFKNARIDYGRIDYGALEGKLQTWEINTNPVLLHLGAHSPGREYVIQRFLQQIKSALEAVDCKGNVKSQMPVSLKHDGKRPEKKDSVSRFIRPIVSFALDKYYYYEFPYRYYVSMRNRIIKASVKLHDLRKEC
jgi:hypothetical protein